MPIPTPPTARLSLLRSSTSASSSPGHPLPSGTSPQPIDFPYTGSSLRPFLSTSFKTSAERSFSSGPDAARFRDPGQHDDAEDEVEDDDMLLLDGAHHPTMPSSHPHAHDTDAEGVFTFSSPYLGSKTLAPDPALDTKHVKASPDPASFTASQQQQQQHHQHHHHPSSSSSSSQLAAPADPSQRTMSPGWAAASLGKMTLGSPDIRPVTGESPLPSLSALGPAGSSTSTASINALGTSPANSGHHHSHVALAHRRLSNHRAPTMRDVYGSGSSSNAAGLYGVSPAGAASRLSSSLPASSGFPILPGTSPSSAATATARRAAPPHPRSSRPGLTSASSTTGSAASAMRQGPYSRPSHGPGSAASHRSHSRNRLSFSQQGKDGVDRNTSGLGLLGAAALADAASPPFALRATRVQHHGDGGVDADVDGIDFAMEDIEGPYADEHTKRRGQPSSSDVEDDDSDLDGYDDEDEHVRDTMMLSLVNEVDDAEATEDESEEIKEHIRSSGASSYTKPGAGAGPLAQVHTLGGAPHRNHMPIVGARSRPSRHSVGGPTSASFSGPSSLGLNFREAHGHAPHQPYPSRALLGHLHGHAHSHHHPHHHPLLGSSTRSPRLGGAAELEAAFPTTTLSSSPVYSSSVPTSSALQRQVSAEQFSHASALAAMRHYPFGSSPGVASASAGAGAGNAGATWRTQKAQQAVGGDDEGGSEYGGGGGALQSGGGGSGSGEPSSLDGPVIPHYSGMFGNASKSNATTSGGGGGLDENAEVAMIRDRLGGAAHCSAFISKLWYLLINPALYGRYIRWSEAGDSIILSNDPDVSAEFANEVLPKLFKHGNNASFIRQLNLYGFQRVPTSRLLDAAELKVAARLQREGGGSSSSPGGGANTSTTSGRSSSRTRHSDASASNNSNNNGASDPTNTSSSKNHNHTTGASTTSSTSTSAAAAGGTGTLPPMTTALHLYGPHSSFAHPSFRRGQESLLPSMKPRSSKKPKVGGGGAAGGGGASGKGGAGVAAGGGGEGKGGGEEDGGEE